MANDDWKLIDGPMWAHEWIAAQAKRDQSQVCACCKKTFGVDYLWTCERCRDRICSTCVAIGAGNPTEHGYELGVGLCQRCHHADYPFNMATGQIEIRPCDHVVLSSSK